MMVLFAIIILKGGVCVIYISLTKGETLKGQKFRGIIVGVACIIIGLLAILQSC